MRIRYKLSDNELNSLVAGLTFNGAQTMYQLMKEKTIFSMSVVMDMDSTLMDMSEEVFSLVRPIEDDDSAEAESLKKTYYLLSSMLKRLAYDCHFQYSRKKIQREFDDNRFLRIVASNNNHPTFYPEG